MTSCHFFSFCKLPAIPLFLLRISEDRPYPPGPAANLLLLSSVPSLPSKRRRQGRTRTHQPDLQQAAEVGMNRSAFCSYFKRCKGMTFSQFVTQYRLHTACQLLKPSQKQVSEIAYRVGVNDVPHFVRVFTKAVGMSPSKYRKYWK